MRKAKARKEMVVPSLSAQFPVLVCQPPPGYMTIREMMAATGRSYNALEMWISRARRRGESWAMAENAVRVRNERSWSYAYRIDE